MAQMLIVLNVKKSKETISRNFGNLNKSFLSLKKWLAKYWICAKEKSNHSDHFSGAVKRSNRRKNKEDTSCKIQTYW